MKQLTSNPTRWKFVQVALLSTAFLILCILHTEAQKLPKALILTGNGNIPVYKEEYPPWRHEFQNEKVIDILKGIAEVDVTEDLSVLHKDRLREYDLVISNSIFLTPNEAQFQALYDFVANGKSYMTLHCGILSLLNWDKYEDFIGGIFIGGPATVPSEYKVVTDNVEFWGYEYSFRKYSPHPISLAADDFVTKDELYHIEPSTRDFHVIARAENFPVMWWHPVGKGKVMSFTLGHDEAAKNNPGYQSLLRFGVQWLTGVPIILGEQPNPVSTRNLVYKNFMALSVSTPGGPDGATFSIARNTNPEIFTAEVTAKGEVTLRLTGKSGEGKFVVSVKDAKGYSSSKEFSVRVVQDGEGNIASYHGNTAVASSFENKSPVFYATNVIDDDVATRWGSAPADTISVEVDLQKVYPIGKIVLRWEGAFATRYEIHGSRDGKTWNTLATVTDGNGDVDEHQLASTQARYLKVIGTQRAPGRWGYSLYEMEVYQPQKK